MTQNELVNTIFVCVLNLWERKTTWSLMDQMK